MKKLLTIVDNNNKRRFIFLKDKYGHNRINLGIRYKFHLDSRDVRTLCEDSRFDQNAFITDDRIIFNGLAPEDLSSEELEFYKEDIK